MAPPPAPLTVQESSSSDEDADVVAASRRNRPGQPGQHQQQQQQRSKNQPQQRNRQRGATNGTKPGLANGADDATKKKKVVVGKAWETSVATDGPSDKSKHDLASSLEAQIELQKRQRLRPDTQPFQRGIIRHVVLVIDMTAVMVEKDIRPNRFLAQIRYAQEFVQEFFEQNPISQMAIVGMHDGVAVMISELSGKPDDHNDNLLAVRAGTILSAAVPGLPSTVKVVSREPKGNPSLQNALEMVRALLYHTPSHGTREAIVILGALLSVDPGDIHQTVEACVRDRIKVSILGMGARLRVCSEICAKTNGGDEENTYTVAMDGFHLRELLMSRTTPPVMRSRSGAAGGRGGVEAEAASVLLMGFPSRTGISQSSSAAAAAIVSPDDPSSVAPTLCACHGHLSREGYVCPRCYAKVCTLPVSCPCCDLTLVLSTHLARSYHHLFPLPNFVAVDWPRALDRGARRCVACLQPLPDPSPEVLREWRLRKRGNRDGHQHGTEAEDDENGDVEMTNPDGQAGTGRKKSTKRGRDEDGKDGPIGLNQEAKLVASESSRYECLRCKSHFCIDCDVFCHQVLHNCPGCLGAAAGSGAVWGPGSWDELLEPGRQQAKGAK